ncbi:hypothetical protein RRG08_059620 [Elysia crispata]|uniref:Uncharacterized protein n=1 Tax=Elysia crispata TaxID=231223 RepID=A0AAE1D576_9GAST|nr:hypothetical protein RRG08_059620 [Elysia crispata]
MIAARDIDVDADFEIIGASSVSAPRALFDAENDDVAHREVAEPIITDDGWATPPFTRLLSPAFSELQQTLAYNYRNTTTFPSSPADLLPHFFTRDFWTLLCGKKQIEWVISFTKFVPAQLGNRSIFHGWEPVEHSRDRENS